MSHNRACGCALHVSRLITVVSIGAILLWPGRFWPGTTAQAQSSASPRASAAVVPRSTETERLLRVGSEAVQRRDWKLAIDSLQRVLDGRDGSVLVPDPEFGTGDQLVLVSAQNAAERVLAAMPDAGRAAYRVLHDGQAKTAYLRARDKHDSRALGEMVDRFLLTAWGHDAAVLAAAWALDAGRNTQALDLIDRVASRCGAAHTDEEAVHRSIIRVVALTRLGEASRGHRELAALIDNHPTASSTSAIGAVNAWLSKTSAQRPYGANSALRLGISIPGSEDATWSTRGGGITRSGIMSSVEAPTINYPNIRKLPTSGLHNMQEQPVAPLGTRATSIPALHACIDDGRLFIKSNRTSLALDLETLTPLWFAAGGSDIQDRLDDWARDRWAARFPGAVLPPTSGGIDRAIDDYITASLSVYQGRVLSIERSGVGAAYRAGDDHSTDSGILYGTRLVAYHAATGVVSWQRGRTDDPEDPLGRVEFLAPPILVAGLLWTPVLELRTADRPLDELLIVGLDPHTGTERRRERLCVLPNTTTFGGTAIFPAAAEHTLYIPTAHGLLFAFDAVKGVVLWASQYPTTASVPSSGRRLRSPPRPGPWTCSPPVMCGANIVLATREGHRLMGFERRTGRLLWSVAVPVQSEYIVAGTADTVFLGGEAVVAIDARTGDVRWATSTLPPAGRAALSGERIYLPTVEGLVVLDATSGERRDTRTTEQLANPLGNLLCIAGRLISVDRNRVQTFLDSSTYEEVRTAFDDGRSDPRLVLKLAALELQRGVAEAARTILTDFEDDLSPAGDSYVAYARHLRFEALMVLADGAEAAETTAYLEEACEAAQTLGDRVRAERSLADHWRTTGRAMEAYRGLLTFALTIPLHDSMIPEGQTPNGTPDDPKGGDSSLVRRARDIVADDLRAIESTLPRAALNEWIAESEKMVSDAAAELTDSDRRKHAITLLEFFSEMEGSRLDGQIALMALGADARSEKRYEVAEQYLRQSLRQNRTSDSTDASLAALVDLYTEQGPALEQMVDSYRRRRLDDAPQPVAQTPFVELVAEEPWSHRLGRGSPRLVRVRGATSRSRLESASRVADVAGGLLSSVITIADGSVLRAHSTTDGTLLWESELSMLGGGIRMPPPGEGSVSQRWAARDGQILVINSRHGIHAVGAVTGKRLWAVGYDGPSDSPWHQRRDQCIDAGQGYVVCERQAGTISALRSSDGQVVWERLFTEGKAGRIRIHGRWVTVVSEDGESVTLYELRTGRLGASYRFDQFKRTGGVVQPVFLPDESLVVGPDGTRVVAYRIADELEAGRSDRLHGLERQTVPPEQSPPDWSVDVGDELSALVDLGDGHLLCALQRGSIRIIEALSGELVGVEVFLETPVPIETAVATGDIVLLVANELRRPRATTHLFGVSRDLSEIVWIRRVNTVTEVTADALAVFPYAVPLVLRLESQANKFHRLGMRTDAAVVLIDKRDGSVVGPAVPLSYRDALDAPNGVMAAALDCLIISTGREITALRTVDVR